MKSITITIDDEVYRAASEEAARLRKSLSELAQEFIERMSRKGADSDQLESEEAGKAREDLNQFLAELNAQPRQEGPSVGPLNREELYQRGVQSAEQAEAGANRAAFLEQLYRLVEEARERNRDKKGPLVLLTRKEWYAGFDQTAPDSPPAVEEPEDEARKKQREEFIRFLDELDARPLKEGPSVGPLNREELYQRGISGH